MQDSVNSSYALSPPGLTPTNLPYGWQIPGVGHSCCQMPQWWGKKERVNAPPPKTALSVWPDVKCTSVF